MRNKFVIALIGAAVLATVPVRAETCQELTESYLEYEAYRSSIEGITEEVGELYSISPELLQAIIEHESRGDATATNADCQGLMQVSIKWHKGRMEKLGVKSLYDPYGNVLTGADYLAELCERGSGDIVYGLLFYSLKADTAKRYYEQGIVTQYVKDVLARAAELEELHGKK